jgi:hypothetical protein
MDSRSLMRFSLLPRRASQRPAALSTHFDSNALPIP